MSIIAPRMSRFQASKSQAAAALARQLIAEGHDVINLTIGQPDFPTPDFVKEAGKAAIDGNFTRYTNRDGVPELKQAVRDKFKRENGLDYRMDQVVITSGAKQAISDVFLATLQAGDEVIIPAPYWSAYPDLVQLAAGTPVFVPCPHNNGFKMLPEDLEAAITPQTKWVSINSPSNPSGAVYSRDELKALGDVLLRHPHVHVIADDIYEHLIYDGREFCTIAQVVPELFDRTVTINGVSKAYSMTGWRIGFAGGPAEIILEMGKLQGQLSSSPNHIGQMAALAALNGPRDHIVERGRIMQERRDVMVAFLNASAGLSCHSPDGAMYIYCSVAGAIGKRRPDGRLIENDTDFTIYLLDAARVAVVQGESYGLSPYVRISYVQPVERLREAGERIRRAMAQLV